ncbi:MAG: helix-turn-helix domain-containing protein [Faecalibacterium sp.]|nr:helix-turn-helix domain-containing protein [Ruminococcus sp.]MCM1392173.1 helix-turn-helix domain-containing protein [Ruminococcus sp.]MCM1486023.1 helix-turn-helix domain-containing protein [Faecalibacterium sp.]
MYQKLQALLDKEEKNAYTVSKDTGIPYSCIADWKSGKSKPKADKLLILARYFDVPIEYFLN